ncbi:hypothetical protein DVH05_024681 [Phytophthora capsici]|nr:hypothetical protein DVH05_010628 [Phytophthora capsici]KAG1707996.1 hypothetical protein DVH05_024681 [Phytophthora capsici]
MVKLFVFAAFFLIINGSLHVEAEAESRGDVSGSENSTLKESIGIGWPWYVTSFSF